MAEVEDCIKALQSAPTFLQKTGKKAPAFKRRILFSSLKRNCDENVG